MCAAKPKQQTEYRVRGHKVEGIPFLKAGRVGNIISPEIVVLHDTASPLTKGNSARYLQNNTPGVSVHFVIERDGSIEQQVPTNRRANHAGRSSYHGRIGCNTFSLGIEIVNPGKMTPVSDGIARPWWGGVLRSEQDGDISVMTTPEHGFGAWMGYSPEQMAALLELLECLFRDIPTLKDITTHWYISPGRKVDTNPLFPLEHVRAKVLGRDDPAEIEAEDQSAADHGSEMVEIDVRGTLNMRRWPSFNPNVIAGIPAGTVVPVLRRGVFAGREWLRVLFNGHEGWIVARYAAPVTFQQ